MDIQRRKWFKTREGTHSLRLRDQFQRGAKVLNHYALFHGSYVNKDYCHEIKKIKKIDFTHKINTISSRRGREKHISNSRRGRENMLRNFKRFLTMEMKTAKNH